MVNGETVIIQGKIIPRFQEIDGIRQTVLLTMWEVVRPFRSPQARKDGRYWEFLYLPPHPLLLRTHKEGAIHAAGIVSSTDLKFAGHLSWSS